MRSIALFRQKYVDEGLSMRLGQAFVNWYMSTPWPELFYEKNDKVAMEMITKHLVAYCYYEQLPSICPCECHKHQVRLES